MLAGDWSNAAISFLSRSGSGFSSASKTTRTSPRAWRNLKRKLPVQNAVSDRFGAIGAGTGARKPRQARRGDQVDARGSAAAWSRSAPTCRDRVRPARQRRRANGVRGKPAAATVRCRNARRHRWSPAPMGFADVRAAFAGWGATSLSASGAIPLRTPAACGDRDGSAGRPPSQNAPARATGRRRSRADTSPEAARGSPDRDSRPRSAEPGRWSWQGSAPPPRGSPDPPVRHHLRAAAKGLPEREDVAVGSGPFVRFRRSAPRAVARPSR